MGSAVANFRLDSDRRGAPSFPSSLFARRDFDFLFVFFCMGFVCFCQCFLFVCLFAVSLFRFGVGFVLVFFCCAGVRSLLATALFAPWNGSEVVVGFD